ncbi:hypothetical protein J28TS4_15250 [Paenibacillus lautus]|nr:hypothetical protein J28TS4_15250 [Paenibacillus lautus]
MGENLISLTSPSSLKIVKLVPIKQKSRYYSDFLWDPVLVIGQQITRFSFSPFVNKGSRSRLTAAILSCIE